MIDLQIIGRAACKAIHKKRSDGSSQYLNGTKIRHSSPPSLTGLHL